MRLRWTREAATDLEGIAEYLVQHVPERAAALIRTIYEVPSLLLDFPLRGRPGKKAGTRELVMLALPYVIVYTVRDDVVVVVRILHGAQQWP